MLRARGADDGASPWQLDAGGGEVALQVTAPGAPVLPMRKVGLIGKGSGVHCIELDANHLEATPVPVSSRGFACGVRFANRADSQNDADEGRGSRDDSGDSGSKLHDPKPRASSVVPLCILVSRFSAGPRRCPMQCSAGSETTHG